ncbi:hypothetical protein GHT06_004452 [Daphnia sinensis]|uniref:Integrase catalytic domain-containing protein n=1 Tax=Daphnia sinensis TaxID=1820382 RepID=A0AAD5KEY8_9CRUS|nr:hypothetical protein GHT06_004452 [Daphnia sinensis]
MRSKLYGEAAEEFDTFKLDHPIRAQEYAAFHNMKREPEENMRRYANRIRKAFHKTYPMEGILDSATAASREQMMMDRFLEGLPSDVQIPLKYKKFASFEALIDRAELTALAVEESQTRVRIHAAYASTNVPSNQNELTSVLEALHRLSAKVDQNATTQNMELQQSLAEMKRQLAHKPPQMGGKPRDPNVTQPEAFKRAALFCEFHNTYGFHTEADCFAKLQQKNEVCRLCRNLGHRQNFCPTIRNPRPPPPAGHYADTPTAPTGALRAIVTDRGSNFTSELFSSLCRALQIKQMKTTAYHPQTNGLTERFNKTVVEMLRKYMEQGFSKWEEVLGPVAFAYRNSVHSSTLETPYFLNHGRDPSQLMQRLHEAFALVKANLTQAREQQRAQYDKRAREQEFNIGDKVLIDVRTPMAGTSKKLIPRFMGPYRVTKINDNHTVEIQECPCVDFQESHNHTGPPALANELETPRPTEGEYPLQEDRDLIDLDAGLPSLSEGMETPNLHDEPALDSPPPPKQPPSTALEPVAPPIPVVVPRPERRPGLRPWSVLRPPNCLDTLFVMSLLALLSPTPLAAFNATVCDCDGAPNLGFLEFTEEDCSFEAAPTPPVPITYAIYSTLPEVKRFAGHMCSMWVATTTVYKDFMQWNQVSHGRQPIEVDAATCRRMRDSRQCRGKAMDITGPNSFSLEGHPFVETSWLRTATEKMTNCRLEEVTLQSECPNCTISSPLGDIPGAINGSFQHNLVTLVWNDSWKEAKPCELRVIEKGLGVKFDRKRHYLPHPRSNKAAGFHLLNTKHLRLRRRKRYHLSPGPRYG